jgi:TolB-like protein/cytochrome c-type biogenesis protein CcmH/NrfG
VIARNSSFTYKGKPVKVQQVAEELGVQYVLEGSVRRQENRVRITAQFVDALTGRHVFSERYDRDLKEIFAIQDEIAIKVLTALRIALKDEQWARFQAKGVQNLDAYFKLLEAGELTQRVNKEDNARARRLAEEALALEPRSSRAYHLLAVTHFWDYWLGPPKSPEESTARGIEMARKAIELEENNPYPHGSLAMLYINQGDYDRAVAAGELAASLEPNSAIVLTSYGSTLYHAGRPADAIPVFQRVLRLSPVNPPSMALANIASSHRMLDQYEEAVDYYKRLLRDHPRHFAGNLGLAATYALMGRPEDAQALAQQYLKINPSFTLERFARTIRQRDRAQEERFLAALRKAGLPDKPHVEKADPAKAAYPLPDKPSIAVLPFDNMSGDPTQDFFSDGITEEIISALARVSGLFVIARNSTFTYKGKSVWVPDVARDLGVQYVLEGSVRRAGDRVRITAQLIDGKTNQHLWSETYDRELKDVFAVQDEITMKILTSVKVKLTGGEDQISPTAKRATNLQAYLKILEGVAHVNDSKFSEGRRLFEEALSLDPKSPAYSWVGFTYLMDVWFGPTATQAQALGKAFEYGEKCLDQDETNETCHRTLGYAYTLKRDHEKALHHGRRSIELNPNSAMSASFLAFSLRCAGEYEEAVRQCERAIRLDPRDSVPFFHMGTTYVMMKRHEDAIQALRKSIEINPKQMPAWVALTMAYSSLDRMEDARAAAAEVLKRSPNFSVEHFVKAMPYKDEEPRQFMADALRKAGLK